MDFGVNLREFSLKGRACQPRFSAFHHRLFAVAEMRSAAFRLALSAVMIFLLMVSQRVWSQQPMQWPTDDASTDQYVPDQQQGYGQAQYQQPQQYGQQNGYPQQNYPQQGYGQQIRPLNPEELEQLVAPIALYPDAVLAQILAASTYPAQVASADQWLRSMGNASPEMVAAGASAQASWDPSVKALTAFPQVLEMLDRNLQWTTNLGNAYYNQPQDVLQTVQVMRGRAQQAGNLQSTPQEQVSYNQGNIELAPANPQVVYVPNYNPWAVYGQPVSPYPDFSPVDTVGAVVGTAVQYGLGFAMSAFLGAPFGLLSWGLDWLANAVLFDHEAYCSHSFEVRDWGFPYGGPRAFGGWGDRGWQGGDRGFGRGDMGYNVAISHGAAGTVVWQSRAGLCWWIAKVWQRVRFRLWRSVRGRVRAARSAGIQPHAFGNRPATALWKQPARLCRQTTAAIRESRIRIQLESAAHAELWRQAGNGLRCSVSELSCLRIRGIGLQWWRFWKRFLQVFCGLIWGFAALRRLPPLRRRS